MQREGHKNHEIFYTTLDKAMTNTGYNRFKLGGGQAYSRSVD
jgi:hypothetical protein